MIKLRHVLFFLWSAFAPDFSTARSESLEASAKLGNQDIEVRIVNKNHPSGPVFSLNKITTILVTILPKKKAGVEKKHRLFFDATMPAHRHGMVVKPKILDLGGDVFEVQGVKLHMRGEWELSVTVELEKESKTIRIPYKL